MYSNEKIKRLIRERDMKVLVLNKEIHDEIQKEKARHVFSLKRFSLMMCLLILPFIAYKINTKIFPKDSIWSWDYYKTNKK